MDRPIGCAAATQLLQSSMFHVWYSISCQPQLLRTIGFVYNNITIYKYRDLLSILQTTCSFECITCGSTPIIYSGRIVSCPVKARDSPDLVSTTSFPTLVDCLSLLKRLSLVESAHHYVQQRGDSTGPALFAQKEPHCPWGTAFLGSFLLCDTSIHPVSAFNYRIIYQLTRSLQFLVHISYIWFLQTL